MEVQNGATLVLYGGPELETGDFFMAQTGKLESYGTNLALLRNFTFAQTDETLWSWGVDTRLVLKGAGAVQQSLEIGGRDLGLNAAGFASNFNLPTLRLSGVGTYASLADLIDNGNRSSDEALYVDLLEVLAGTTLNLNNLHLYT